MCGIGGILLKRRPSLDHRAMAVPLGASLAHRGRDGTGAFSDDWISLHSARHAVIAVDDARQPLFDC
ncbi:hypothetical protein, partial [Streptomyces noursei]